MGIGTNLKRILSEKGITIKQLANVTGIPVNTLYSVTQRDSDSMRAGYVHLICQALQIDMSDILPSNTCEKEINYVNSTFGQRLKKQREKAGFLTCDAFGEVIGCAPARIALWESDKQEPTVQQLARIFEVLECTPADLLNPNQKATAEPYYHVSSLCDNLLWLNDAGCKKVHEYILDLIASGKYSIDPATGSPVCSKAYIDDCDYASRDEVSRSIREHNEEQGNK